MKCPYCGIDNNRVYGHGVELEFSYKRYRKCLSCGRNFKTYEYYTPDLPTDCNGRINGLRRKAIYHDAYQDN